ncbi:MAG: hypothetical protein JWO06_2892 [Bacteroidota bacterium]|nr:hypothetical protein [Bacteroidota bacterium]
MNRLLSTILLIFLVVVSSFQRHSTSSKISKIKEVVNLKTGSTSTYGYDKSGRLVNMLSTLGNNTRYEYWGNRVIIKFNDSGSLKYAIDTLLLNGKGLAESRLGHFNGVVAVDNNVYDGKGFLVQNRFYLNQVYMGTTNWTIINDNKKMYAFTDEKRKQVSTIYYECYPDKANTIGNENMGMTFWGSSSKNLLKKSVSIGPKNDTLLVLQYQYRFDNKGRVSQKVSYKQSGTLEDSLSYNYY